MYKMIIVDDEPLILTGLKNLIEWEIYGIELIAEAEDGMNAYLLIKELQPDIALIDINMPNMNGIELLDLCSHLPHCPKFIILSGYNDFEYVRTAMRHGAVNYLLKPVDQKELTNTIISAVRILDDTREQKQQFQESLIALRNDILLRILTNRIDGRELREKCRFVNLTFRCSNMRIGILKALSPDSGQSGKWSDFSIVSHCEEFAGKTCDCHAGIDSQDNIVLIFKDYTQVMTEHHYEQILKTLSGQLSRQISAPVISVLSGNAAAVSDLPAAYSSGIQSLERKEITQSLFRKDSIAQFEKDPSYLFNYNRLTICFETQDKEALRRLLDCYFTDMLRRDGSGSLEGIKFQLIEFIIYATEELKSSLISGADMDTHKKEAFRIIRSAASLGELEDKLFLLFAALMDQMNEYNNPDYSQPVQNVLAYIHSNYHDPNLALKTMAAHLEVNAAYLGRQFALETSEYFSDYLNRLRVAKAVHLLKTTGRKTAEIATAVGFANITYFFTIFKKITGGRPGDFRRG